MAAEITGPVPDDPEEILTKPRGRVCWTCTSPLKQQINELIEAGYPLARVREYMLAQGHEMPSRTALSHHMKNHMRAPDDVEGVTQLALRKGGRELKRGRIRLNGGQLAAFVKLQRDIESDRRTKASEELAARAVNVMLTELRGWMSPSDFHSFREAVWPALSALTQDEQAPGALLNAPEGGSSQAGPGTVLHAPQGGTGTAGPGADARVPEGGGGATAGPGGLDLAPGGAAQGTGPGGHRGAPQSERSTAGPDAYPEVPEDGGGSAGPGHGVLSPAGASGRTGPGGHFGAPESVTTGAGPGVGATAPQGDPLRAGPGGASAAPGSATTQAGPGGNLHAPGSEGSAARPGAATSAPQGGMGHARPWLRGAGETAREDEKPGTAPPGRAEAAGDASRPWLRGVPRDAPGSARNSAAQPGE